MRKLKLAIEKHPMSNKNILSNDPKNKMEAIRNYVHNIETEIAVLDMKEQMIHYMAKIVVLDAMSLAENISLASENEKDIISTKLTKLTILVLWKLR